jgi:hypothetical protein
MPSTAESSGDPGTGVPIAQHMVDEDTAWPTSTRLACFQRRRHLVCGKRRRRGNGECEMVAKDIKSWG